MTFTEKLLLENITIALDEALKIKKKGDGITSIDKRQMHKDAEHAKEIAQAKADREKLTVGVVKGITVEKSFHATEVRDSGTNAGQSRDSGIDNKELLKVFEKAIKNPNFKQGQRTMISYKNKKGKYDLMSVGYDRNVITIITFVQKGSKSPYDAFSRSSAHDKAGKVVIESIIDEMIALEFIPDALIIVD
jgi:hypothetical protein